MNLCQPELQLDAEGLNARLTRLEEQIKTGSFTAVQIQPKVQAIQEPEDDRPPFPDDADAPPVAEEEAPVSQEPIGFWSDLVAAARKELKPPASGFFVASPGAPIQGVLKGDILELVSRKASAKLGRPIRVTAADKTAVKEKSRQMEQLLNFGKAHSDIVNIK